MVNSVSALTLLKAYTALFRERLREIPDCGLTFLLSRFRQFVMVTVAGALAIPPVVTMTCCGPGGADGGIW